MNAKPSYQCPRTLWQCTRCDKRHEKYLAAKYCCTLWMCECGHEFAHKYDADECCRKEADNG